MVPQCRVHAWERNRDFWYTAHRAKCTCSVCHLCPLVGQHVKLELMTRDVGVVPKNLEINLEAGKLFDIRQVLGGVEYLIANLFPEGASARDLDLV